MDYGHTNSPKRTDDIFDVAITPGVGEKDEVINPEADNSLNSEVNNSDNRKIGSEALRFKEAEPTDDSQINPIEIIDFSQASHTAQEEPQPNVIDFSILRGEGRDKTVPKTVIKEMQKVERKVESGELDPSSAVETIMTSRETFLNKVYGRSAPGKAA
ncbi:hypothetical protein IKG28_01610 [Candidatus Saccharibacteria bacterium]|nr:hypothetical protein [Candidatus Saccharibacteria bacterium]